MNCEEFIEKQVKFMYGKYYEEIIKNNIIYLDKNEIKENILPKNWNTGKYYCMISDILNNNYHVNNLHGNGINNHKYICEKIQKYWDKNKDPNGYVLVFNWHDFMYFDDFILCHNRKYKNSNYILFQLVNYYEPKNIKIDDSNEFKNKNNKLMWRGQSSGRHILNLNTRCNVVINNFNIHPNIDIGFSELIYKVYHDNKELLEHYLKNKLTKTEMLESKFILNLDGNDIATSFPWVLASNSCPLHNYPFDSETYIFGSGILPYVHFVPIKSDGSDLLDQYNWCINNLDKCEEIANNGKEYTKNYIDEEIYEKMIQRFIELYPLKIK
jgi:hypothetical protein